jgi:heat shock protein HslJ
MAALGRIVALAALAAATAAGAQGLRGAWPIAPLSAIAANGEEHPMDLTAAAGAWTVFEIDGKPVPEGVTPALVFSEGAVTGSTGCNSFDARVAVTDGWLSIGPTSTTRKLCPPPARTTEVQFLRHLAMTGGLRAEADGTLSLLAGDTVVMRARR